ncbi:hypothetical protein WJX84_008764 [Apatococcus fuscideae]|uniref:CBS domain-containing protein n=1 Tax=Apatococcus fuscideae TaxID=2026836 RepID=A0AAW1TDL1_9CHLO
MAFFVPTKFTWRFGGQAVHLCGSFTRWVETVPMAAESSPGVFSAIVHLPPGYHQYKFIVDGDWRHDEAQPFMPDPLGNVNNWLFVRRPDGMSSPNLAHSQPQLQQLAQQQAAQLLSAAPGPHPRSPSPSHLDPLSIPQSQGTAAHNHGQSIPHVRKRSHEDAGPSESGATSPHGLPPGRRSDDAPQRAASQLSEDVSVPRRASSSGHVADVDMTNADSIGSSAESAGALGALTPMSAGGAGDEPGYTRKKIREFLCIHTAYELIPESGKIIMLDADLPMRQGFHALHEQGIASAPLWDAETGAICGMLSPSDFIHTLRALRSNISGGGTTLSEAEMDRHSIRALREAAAAEGRMPKRVVFVRPTDSLAVVVEVLFHNGCYMAPVLSCEAAGPGEVCGVLHTATISNVLATLMRHFRASLNSLPLLGQPLGALPIGSWSPHCSTVQREQAAGLSPQGEERRDRRKVLPLQTVRMNTLLTTALGLLLEEGISCLPVVDEDGALLDMYARSDITMLARGNSYQRLQVEDMTVGTALSLAAHSPSNNRAWHAPTHAALHQAEGMPATRVPRLQLCTARDSLRQAMERLSVPGVRRLFVVEPSTRRVEGIVSLSDVAAYLFL